MHSVLCPRSSRVHKPERSQGLPRWITANYVKFETEECLFESEDETLSFSFNIASKGGGTTRVLLEIGEEDLPAILEMLLLGMPNFEVQMLDTQRKATELRQLQHDKKTSELTALADRLDETGLQAWLLEEQLGEEYFRAPDDNDEAEKARYDMAGNISSELSDIQTDLALLAEDE